MEEPAQTWKEETTAATAGVDGVEKDVKSVRAMNLIILFLFYCLYHYLYHYLVEQKSGTACVLKVYKPIQPGTSYSNKGVSF